MNGTISRVISDKGFGFIQGEDGQEYFMHRSAVRDGSVFEQLREGQTVLFDAGRGDKGLRAENVRLSWAGTPSSVGRRRTVAPSGRTLKALLRGDGGVHPAVLHHPMRRAKAEIVHIRTAAMSTTFSAAFFTCSS